MKDRSNKNGKVYKFRPKNKDFDYKNVVKKEFPKGNIGESEGDVDLLMIFGMDSEAKKKNPERYKKVKKELENKKKIKGELAFMSYAPVMFTSALKGQRLGPVIDKAKAVAENRAMRISTGQLNSLIADAVLMNNTPSDKGKRLKIYLIRF